MRPDEVIVPEDALKREFLAATGSGRPERQQGRDRGPVRVDLFKLGFHPDAYERLKRIGGSRMTNGGELLITARRSARRMRTAPTPGAGWRR